MLDCMSFIVALSGLKCFESNWAGLVTSCKPVGASQNTTLDSQHWPNSFRNTGYWAISFLCSCFINKDDKGPTALCVNL